LAGLPTSNFVMRSKAWERLDDAAAWSFQIAGETLQLSSMIGWRACALDAFAGEDLHCRSR
jgi:hypothetical protein